MLPACYGWLAREPGPKMIVEALRLYGMLETPGSSNNPTIMAWAKEVAADVADVYKADSIPWLRTLHGGRREACRQGDPAGFALDVVVVGAKSPAPALGDVLVFVRNGGGHVGLYV